MNVELNNIDEKKKKVFKGMSLIEVIVAMVVLVIVAALVAQVASGIVSNVRTSKSVVKKVNYQQSFVTSTNGALSGSVTFKLEESGCKDITAKLYEAPTDPAALYKNYDKAGNLKYFRNTP